MNKENCHKGEPLAHVNPDTGEVQTLKDHLENVRYLAEKNCPIELLLNIVQACAIFHDAGKAQDSFGEYMQDVLEHGNQAHRRQIDHSSAGGILVEDLTGNASVANLIANAVYAHHGLEDCIDLETGETVSERRRKKNTDLRFIQDQYYEIEPKKEILLLLQKAHKDTQTLIRKANTLFINKNSKFGSAEFYMGMYERLILSVLIDSDWSDTASAMSGEKLPERMTEAETVIAWREMLDKFRIYMQKMQTRSSGSPLNKYRSEISDACYRESQEGVERYRLTVPTGAGKTLSSLRFALNRAQKEKKRHIFYISPYNSILEQNAQEIRNAVGADKYVLEHHCNVLNESAADEEAYRRLTENWDSPIVATTAVQLLNTLFSGEKGCIRRMYALCNSIIIFDEVQALPVKCMELFHLAVNFLTECCNTTVVLCSATQPSLAAIAANNVMECKEMAGVTAEYIEAFRRVEIEDKTNLIPGGMEIEDAKHFIWKAFQRYGQVLVILNTKAAALNLYEALKADENADCELFHLSTNMCPENRRDELEAVKKALEEGRKIICVSTQLVEAGVDFSFGCVIRSLAGLDSIVQAAGRCNRHKERQDGLGKVYIIQMAKNAEIISKMPEMATARDACVEFLGKWEELQENSQDKLDSENAVKRYYEIYYKKLAATDHNFTKYPIEKADTTLIELLGGNPTGSNQYVRSHGNKKPEMLLKQAFHTAGENFQVIEEDAKITVVVPYNEEAEELIAELGSAKTDAFAKKRLLHQMQCYTVGISQIMRDKLGNAVYPVGDTGVLALNKSYYDNKTGVSEMPRQSFTCY